MDEIFIKLNDSLKQQFPFAVYRKPGNTVVTGIFQKEGGNYAADFNEAGFVFAPFDGDSSVFIPAYAAEVMTATFNQKNNAFAKEQPEIDEAAKKAFETLVAKGIEKIAQGHYQKLVLSRTESVLLADNDVTAIYQKLLLAYPNAFCYFFYHPTTGLWMGATPEQLVKADCAKLQTVALAGTQLYKDGIVATWPQKEQQEQQFVTDFILHELQEFTSEINATAPYTFRAGNIVHLKTDISARLKDTTKLEDVIKKLHPTPAVCGLPKVLAKEFVIANESYNREYYAGYLGEVNRDFATGEKRTDLFVNLRCMKIKDDTAQLFIGCGITKDSDPEKEFIETVNKSMTMRRVIGR